MNLDTTLNIFRAIGEETRLRIMVLLARGELTVTELTHILGQSQPRVSRHLKILADAGLVERYREGSWMFYRAADWPAAAGEGDGVLGALGALADSEDRLIARDRERFAQSREARAAQAATYFQENAGEWDTVRKLHLPESDIEERMRAAIGEKPVGLFVDLGTGTGRMLELFADRYETALGFDLSREMLAVARANLEQAGVAHAQVRHGDLFALPVDSAAADLVCLHQVLHFLAEPGAAVREAARLLKPGGRLLISDFAPHELEFLREHHAHRRLGFSDDEVRAWCRAASLNLVSTETLSPQSSEAGRLTVKIWVCAAAESVRKLKTRAA
ncbi:MAG: metalloregulator ArsR/SmtB family transcription factor [Pseudomonadota bacterium]|nr:metalloregulator ArsR/SmtB family transcription factor [Pseudomonadota bacterium]